MLIVIFEYNPLLFSSSSPLLSPKCIGEKGVQTVEGEGGKDGEGEGGRDNLIIRNTAPHTNILVHTC